VHLHPQHPRVNLYDKGGSNANQDSTEKLNLRPHEGGNMSIDQDTRSEGELSLAHMDDEEIKSINESLKGMGLQLLDPNVWIGDTGATTHNTAFIENTINHQAAHAKDNILGISGPPAETKTIVDIPCEVVQDGKKEKMALKDVTYVPDSQYNLFSLIKLMSNGWIMSWSKSTRIRMTRGNNVLSFDETIYTPKGVLYVIVMKRREQCQTRHCVGKESMGKESGEVMGGQLLIEAGAAITVEEKIKKITINKAHAICGHMGQAEVQELCEYVGQGITKQGFQQGESKNKESDHWMWQGIPDEDEEELECDLLNRTWNM
jgi:hypothetical protein